MNCGPLLNSGKTLEWVQAPPWGGPWCLSWVSPTNPRLAHSAPGWSLNTPDTLLPQGLCTCLLSIWSILPRCLQWFAPLGLFFLSWGIVDFQCCVSFRRMAKWFSYIHTLFFRLFSLIGYYKILSIVGPCWLSILYIVVNICSSQTPNLSFSPPPFPFGNHKFVFYVCGSISVL